MTKRHLHVLSIAISLGLLALIYSLIDMQSFVAVWRELQWGWLVLAMLITVPLFMATAWRLQKLSESNLGLGLSCRVNAQASTMNLVAPAKLGDVGKCIFLAQHSKTPVSGWFTLCVFEKLLDLATLLAWCALGLLLSPLLPDGVRWTVLPVGGAAVAFFVALLFRKITIGLMDVMAGHLPDKLANILRKLREEWAQLSMLMQRQPQRFWLAVLVTIALWAGHLLQIWLLAQAVQLDLDLWTMLALVPLALVVGLLPFTLAGIGTRDAAFVLLLGAYGNAPAAAALGLLTTFRYILPALAGIPLLARDMATWRQLLKDKN